MRWRGWLGNPILRVVNFCQRTMPIGPIVLKRSHPAVHYGIADLGEFVLKTFGHADLDTVILTRHWVLDRFRHCFENVLN